MLSDSSSGGPTIEQYLGDLQMHSEWSDGSPTVQDIADACRQRGYQYSAVTDHSYGLKIAGGMSMAEATEQRKAIDDVNAKCGNQFRLLQGIEANIDATGQPMSPDPFHAVQNAIQNYRIDEILISTLEGQQSKWLDEGLIENVRGITEKPVIHVAGGRVVDDGGAAAREADDKREPVGAGSGS